MRTAATIATVLLLLAGIVFTVGAVNSNPYIELFASGLCFAATFLFAYAQKKRNQS